MAEVPLPEEEVLLTHFIVSDDVERSRRFYTEVLGGRVAFSSPGGPTNVALSNSWVVINGGGGPTDDKPEVILETPGDPNRVSSFVNIRVKDMETVYSEWSALEHLIQTAGFDPMRIGGVEQSSRLEVGGDLHDLVVGSAEASSLAVGA
jgi:hypothetical protein